MAKRAPKITVEPAPAVTETPSLTPNASASFMDGHQGGVRLSWANYSGSFSYANPMSPFVSGFALGPTYDRNLAASVGSEFQFNNSTFATLLDVIDVNAVGVGLTVSSKPDADALGITEDEARDLAHQFEVRFVEWASNPIEVDYTGRFPLAQIAATAFRLAMLTGETAAIMSWKKHRGGRWRTKLNLLLPGQIDQTVTRYEKGRRIVQGIVFDEAGVQIGFMVRSAPLGAVWAAPVPEFLPARTAFGRPVVVHLLEVRDPRQVRGISPLIASLTPSQDRSFLGERVLASAALQSVFSMSVESDDVTVREAFSTEDEQQLLARETFRERWYSKHGVSVAPGKIAFLPKGDKLKMSTPGSPNNTFDGFDNSLVRQAARAGGVSFEDVSGDFSKTSFSASRMAQHVPALMTARRRKVFVEGLYKVAFECFIEEAIATGAIKLPKNAPPFWSARDAYLKAKFLGAPPAEPDKLKAATSIEKELANGTTTLTDVLAARGIDFEDHIEILKSERAVMREAGLVHPIDMAAAKSADNKMEPDDDDV